jgi:pilus assembly protein Flp/PilA
MHDALGSRYPEYMISHSAMFSSLRRLLSDDRGQGLVEYALIVALVSIVAIAALKFLGGKASNTLNNAANAI